MPVDKRLSPAPTTAHKAVLLTAAGALLMAATNARGADVPSTLPGKAAPPATAEERPEHFTYVTRRLSEWKVILGGGVRVAPKYEGSNEFKALPVPFVSAVFGDALRVDPRGASVNVFKTHGFSFSARVGYDLGRQEDDSDRLRGLGDIDASAVVGARVGYETGPIEFYTAINRNIGGSDGFQAKFGADAQWRYQRFLFTAGLSGTWADERYMQSYFGITAQQSAASGLAAYNIGAGFKRVDAETSLTYLIDKNWLVRGQLGVGYLLGDAGNSPIVQTKTQPYGMLTVGYKF